MRHLALILALLPAVAWAQAPQQPATIELPLADWKAPDGVVHRGLASLRQALGSLPYDQVSDFIAMIGNCSAMQIPQKGVTIDTGLCPAVSEARQERAAQEADAAKADKAQIADLQKQLDAAKAPKPEATTK